ncbi:MAG: HAMP domain-containing histidine kinase [Campylobacterales bacterium]|nr:HAMP domain-containing histidine kinase [Campylobacterales bacterium]
MVSLTIAFSFILYNHISYSIDKSIEKSLNQNAQYILATYKNIPHDIDANHDVLQKTLQINVRIVQVVGNIKIHKRRMNKYREGERYFYELLIPHNTDTGHYISIAKDVSTQKQMQFSIYKSMAITNLLIIFLIALYAIILSKMLIVPIEKLNQSLSQMNENMIKTIDVDSLPVEFKRLGESLNGLLNRIENFLMYKKELFIGTAHELKTPLAVMKTKNQVTLMKREITQEKLKEAIEQNIISIDELNKIIGSILEFGRAEGAQFETPETIDIIKYLNKKCEDFRFYAASKDKKFEFMLSPKGYLIKIQPLLLTQILQNFVQNALRFSPKDRAVVLKSYANENQFIIEVLDEGVGIDESMDIFAPFIRSDKSKGTGLGLFLAKSAADALGARLEIKNRDDCEGAVARVILTNYQDKA